MTPQEPVITIPDSVREALEASQTVEKVNLGQVALNGVVELPDGRFNNGVVEVENPGPQAIKQAVQNGSLDPNLVRS